MMGILKRASSSSSRATPHTNNDQSHRIIMTFNQEVSVFSNMIETIILVIIKHQTQFFKQMFRLLEKIVWLDSDNSSIYVIKIDFRVLIYHLNRVSI